MKKRVVEHEFKLEKSVKIFLGILAVGVFLNAFSPVFDIRRAFALDYGDHISVNLSGFVNCRGCN